MDIHQLEVFITAAQYMNFTEASQRLFMVQSAVSHNITTLEKELGIKLFTRSNNALSLTPAGEIFLSEAYKITSIAQESVSRMKSVQAGQVGQISVGFVFPQMIDCFVPNLMAFFKEYPNIEAKFKEHNCITLARMLESNDIDIVFGREDSFIKNDKFRWKSLYVDDFVVMMCKNHPLASEKKVTPNQLAREKIFTMSRETNPGMFDLINFIFMSNGVMPNINDSCNSHFTTIMFARMGLGVVIFPTMYLRYMSDDMTYATIDDPNACHEIGIAWTTNNKNSAQPLFLKAFGISNMA